MNELISLAIVGHFLWHLIATIGITTSIIHSYKVHKSSLWKIIMAVVWLVISILMLYHSLHESC